MTTNKTVNKQCRTRGAAGPHHVAPRNVLGHQHNLAKKHTATAPTSGVYVTQPTVTVDDLSG